MYGFFDFFLYSYTMIEADYLVVGTGAVGMAFADVILEESDATVVMIDRHNKPGGHWNVAYPFVTLHQPSHFYGVSSKELSKGRKNQSGFNKGMWELASGEEVMTYFEDVMTHQFLPTGRLQYFPMCDYKGNGKFESMINGKEYEVKAKKIVDCTYLKVSVPSTHTPNFSLGEDVPFIPINDLVKLSKPYDNYVVVGAGKTGLDALIWLIERDVPYEKIHWIVSRDAWLIDRQNTQPSEDFFDSVMSAQAAQFEAIAAATSIRDLFERLEASGVLMRIDKEVWPSMFHGATVSRAELAALAKVKNVIRKGRIQKLEKEKIHFNDDIVDAPKNALYIDCSARAIKALDPKTVFDGQVITPQTVRAYQPIFSAAFIAHIELTEENDKQKNHYCQVVPLPNHDTDWIRMMSVQMMNQVNWGANKPLRKWLYNNRLDGFSKMVADVDKNDEDKMKIMKRLRSALMPAAFKIPTLMEEIAERAHE